MSRETRIFVFEPQLESRFIFCIKPDNILYSLPGQECGDARWARLINAFFYEIYFDKRKDIDTTLEQTKLVKIVNGYCKFTADELLQPYSRGNVSPFTLYTVDEFTTKIQIPVTEDKLTAIETELVMGRIKDLVKWY